MDSSSVMKKSILLVEPIHIAPKADTNNQIRGLYFHIYVAVELLLNAAVNRSVEAREACRPLLRGQATAICLSIAGALPKTAPGPRRRDDRDETLAPHPQGCKQWVPREY